MPKKKVSGRPVRLIGFLLLCGTLHNAHSTEMRWVAGGESSVGLAAGLEAMLDELDREIANSEGVYGPVKTAQLADATRGNKQMKTETHHDGSRDFEIRLPKPEDLQNTHIHLRKHLEELNNNAFDLKGALEHPPPNPSKLLIPLMPHQLQALSWIQWRETLYPHGGTGLGPRTLNTSKGERVVERGEGGRAGAEGKHDHL
eukprot:1381670-Amorphochlora_amoeboformis.AAC.1